VIVFLHGYGGSFLWYLHYLAEVFPDEIIVAPAYGLSAGFIPAEYVAESMRAAERRLGHALAKPRLIGLSAGGFGACRVYAARPDGFGGLMVMAAYPTSDAVVRFQNRKGAPSLRFVAGVEEVFVKDGTWDTCRRQLAAHGVAAEWATLPSADHFFMLTHEAETKAWLKK
jgi:pimeloyl-ACP methyl ester carboxylesterase